MRIEQRCVNLLTLALLLTLFVPGGLTLATTVKSEEQAFPLEERPP